MIANTEFIKGWQSLCMTHKKEKIMSVFFVKQNLF